MEVVFAPTLDAFREAVRPLLADGVDPREVLLRDTRSAQRALFAAVPVAPTSGPVRARLPRAFFERAERVACARVDDRWDLLYRIAHRLTRGESGILDQPLDPDVSRMMTLDRAVREDEHRMHAFVRFRRTADGRFVAFHRPDHFVLRLAAPFFARRFPAMQWSILTPDESVVHESGVLTYGPGGDRRDAPAEDELDELFRAYYSATFNPARANPRKLLADLPMRFREGLPETRAIAPLLDEAVARVATMHARLEAVAGPASSLVPPRATLQVLRDAASGCTVCEGCDRTNGVVFGEGVNTARVMLVGEQPGDVEDRLQRPFVGPAGQLLDAVLGDLGVARESVYLTNAVKHFHWEPRGKQRLHRSPRASEITACRPWLDAEIEAVKPRTIVCLGGVAARSFMGSAFRLHRARGRVYQTRWAPHWVATHHPAAILRMPDLVMRARLRDELTEDLGRAFALTG